MPRFSKSEKEFIYNKLLEKGEQLFIQHGIKKVTIADLTNAAGIAAGSFYSFFESKEGLFVEIVILKQDIIYADIKKVLDNQRHLPPKDLAYSAIKRLFQDFYKEPIFNMVDENSWSHLSRKISSKLLSRHLEQDLKMIELVTQFGVNLRYSYKQTVDVLQVLLITIKNILNNPNYSDSIDIIIEGTVNQLLVD